MSFPSLESFHRDTPHPRNAPRNEGRGQRNDRPPRFQRDTDFPKPGGDTPTPPPSSSGPTHSQKGRGSDRGGRGSDRGGRGGQDRRYDDRREGRSNGISNSLPMSVSAPSFSTFSSSFNQRSRDHQQGQTGSFQQDVRDHQQGHRDNSHSAGHQQGSRDHGSAPRNQQHGPDSQNQRKGLLNGPGPKALEAMGPGSGSGSSADSRGRSEPSNRRRGNRTDRPSSFVERGVEGGANLNSGPSLAEERGGDRAPGGGRTGGDSHLQNGDVEHRRTGPIKQQQHHQQQQQQPQKNTFHNSQHNSKKRTGSIKNSKGSDPGHMAGLGGHAAWRPGDQCLALYWEDNKVRSLQQKPQYAGDY